MKKTKIIATIGPSSKELEILKQLIENGMDIARLNMTYADYDFCSDIINKINKLNKELNKNVSIMIDTQGPDISVGKFIGGKAILNKDDKIRIYMQDIIGDSTKFSVSYKDLLKDIKTNTTLKINDGLIELYVLEKDIDNLLCEVKIGGEIFDNNGLNIIGYRTKAPFLSQKDKEDIKFAHKMNADFLALSFVRSVEDVLEVSDILIDLGNDHISIIPKIENEQALEEIDDIIKNSDGVMIARGDLGVELPFERIPGIQKSIINKCHFMGKVSIVATEMMSSMENKLRPTRAEVSDVAVAVTDGIDVVMLSGETTIGQYPVETLGMMSKIIEASENDINYYEFLDRTMRTEKQDITGSVAYSSVECANRLKCGAIVTPTMSGYTARKISRFRPTCPIIAMSPNIETVKSLTLYYGVYPVLIDETKNFDKILELAVLKSKQILDCTESQKIIITGGYPFKEVKHTNFMKIEEI
ncbi:MAG: pyruvate kinase [Bacilli bacterium]